MGARYELSTSGRYGQRSKFCFFSHIFRWEAFFLCRVAWPCSSRHVPWRQALFSRVAGSPGLHRAPLNELRPVHHESVFGAPGLSRTRKGCFRYRIFIPYRKRLFFTPNASENASRTGGSLFEHGTHIPYRRRPSQCRREQENNSLRPQNTNALHNLPVTTATHPTTSIHSHLPSHHSYTPSYTLGQQKTPPIQSTTSIHSHPPQAVRKVRFSKCNRPSGPFWQG